MSRDFFVNGPTLVSVKGNTNTAIANVTEFGLSDQPIRVSVITYHDDISVNAWGTRLPPETQFMLAGVNLSMSLVHFDRDVLDYLIMESWAGASAPGVMTVPGTRMGNSLPLYGVDNNLANHFITVSLSSPVGGIPWRFFNCYLHNNMEYPLGTERSILVVNWRCIPYKADPYNGGLGAGGTILCDNNSN
jgi:hypothetical protein